MQKQLSIARLLAFGVLLIGTVLSASTVCPEQRATKSASTSPNLKRESLTNNHSDFVHDDAASAAERRETNAMRAR